MFPGSTILSALCLNDIALQHRCLLNDSPRDVLIISWRLEWDFLALGGSGRFQTLCALLNWTHWACLLDIRKILTFSMFMG